MQKHSTRARLLASSLLCGAVLAGPALAHAQATDNVAVEEIVVTGSRIKRDTFSAPTAIATVSSETIQNSGNVILGDVLMDLPMINAASNAQNTSSTLFNSGQARVDIRGLGPSRTLVLVDGRRHVFSDAASPAVDLNMIPSLMVERVDVVPGAGSAVYGSEAIAGVVNLIMIKKYDGLKLDAQVGTSQEGDGEEYRLGGLWGGKFANDKLNVVVGAEIARQQAIMQKDRDWAYPGIRRSGGATQGVIPASRGNTTPYGVFQLIGGNTVGTARSVALDMRNRATVTRMTAPCSTATVQPTCQDEALFYSGVLNALQNQTSRGSVRGYADYEVTDHVKAFAEFSYAKAKGYGIFQPAFSSISGGPTQTLPIFLTGDNAFLNGPGATAAALRAEWAAAGKPFTQASTAAVGKFWTEFGGRNVETDRDTLRAVVGMNGDFDALDRNFSWDWYAQYGKTSGDTTSFGLPNLQRMKWATDSILVGGAAVCRATTSTDAATAAAAAGCVPWDLVNGASKQAIDYANGQATTTSTIKQTVAAANLTGDLFQLPAGPVGAAVGVEYRKEESTFQQDALSATGALFFNAIGTRKGEYNVKDIYGEIRVPILKDVKFAKELSIEAAGRASDYSTIGTVKQWRLAGEWAPIPDIRFRANKGTSVRAPNIVELFSPQSVNYTNAINDPCDKDQYTGVSAAVTAARVANCSAVITGYNKNTFVSNFGPSRASLKLQQGGNPKLDPETAKTTQVGVVIQPRFVPGLQISYDWYKTNIVSQIGTIPTQTLMTELCYNSTTAYASNPFCGQIKREADGSVSQVTLINQNLAAVNIEGWDSSVQYQFAVADLLQVGDDVGDINLRVDLTRQYHFKIQGLPGQAFVEQANTITNATPEWKANMAATWSIKDLRLQWQTRYLGSMAAFDPAVQVSSRDPYYTGDHFEHDVRATYRFSDKLTVRGGVVNVTNERPPYLPETFAGTSTGSSSYDNRGRFFFLGASMTY